MKKKNNTYYPLLSFFICSGIFAACTKSEITDVPGTIPVEPQEGTGYISLQIDLDKTVKTKASGESSGIPVESSFNGLRLILYNSSDVAIEYYDYPVSYLGNNFEDGGSGVIYNQNTKLLTIPSIEIEKKPHRIIALLNYSAISSENLKNQGYQGVDYEASMTTLPHYSFIGNPVNLYQAFGSDPLKAVQGINYFFWADPTKTIYPAVYTDDILNSARFLMTNANGPLQINVTDIKETAEDAGLSQNRKTIAVERAVAKVGLFKGSNIGTSTEIDINDKTVTVYNGLLNNGRITEPVWATDIINLQSYIVRQLALTAPADGNMPEDENTEQSNRYATDPNFSGVSVQKTGNTANDKLKSNFFYIPADQTDIYLVRNWITDSPPWSDLTELDNNNRTKYEYVTENTMAADEQYEDVTTRIILKCTYAPQGFKMGESYYFYHGHGFKHTEIVKFLADASLIPTQTYPELEGLAEVLTNQEVKNAFWPEEEVEPSASITLREFSFYKNGETFYSIPIRHFDDIESPQKMGYGRYGVVRNNVYRVVIENISGPGYVSLPKPKGMSDRDFQMVINLFVYSWFNYRDLYFDL